MELSKLPTNYNYLDVSQKTDEYIFRIKDIEDEPAALAWLAEFSDVTKSTWRKSKTYPKSGKHNVFKVGLRCVHNTDRRITGKGSSKHTGCPAKMTITVKRVITNSKEKNGMISKYPTIISINGQHNHSTHTAATLKYRDLSDDVKLKLAKLFRQGHCAASALQCLKTDLMLEYGDQYFLIASDGKYLPTYSAVNYLFENKFKKKLGPDNWFLPSQKECSEKSNYGVICDVPDNSISSNETNQPSTSNNKDFNIKEDSLEQFSVIDMENLKNIFRRIEEGIAKDPKNFVPAVRKFLKNIDSYCKTDCGFLSGLHTFAMNSEINSSKASKTIVHHCRKHRISMQPTTIGQRKYYLNGRCKASAVRPCGTQTKHVRKARDYTIFRKLPAGKKKAPHNLLKSVEEQKS